MPDQATNNEEDRHLVARFLSGRFEDDFRALYQRHTRALYGLAHRLTGGKAVTADDLVQETWFRAVGHLDDFRWESSLRTWLRAICWNVYREGARKPGASDIELDENRAPLRVVEGGATPCAVDLERAVAALPPGYRDVLILHDIEGYTHKEIGRLAGIDEGTSKSQLSRARKAVREALRAAPDTTNERVSRGESERS